MNPGLPAPSPIATLQWLLGLPYIVVIRITKGNVNYDKKTDCLI